MANRIYFSACIIATFIFSTVSGTRLDLPTSISIGGTFPTLALNGTCRPPLGATSVFSILVGRIDNQGVKSPMAQVYLNTDTNQVIEERLDGTLRNRLTYSGSTRPANSASFSFSLSDLSCEDAMGYYCDTQFNPQTAGQSEFIRNVSAQIFPESFRMLATPNSTYYDPGRLVNFTCFGRIGNNFPNDLSTFYRWEVRDLTNPSFPTSWVPYPNPSNISYRDPTLTTDGCSYDSGSTLMHTITEDDNNKEIRCYIIQPEQYSGSKNISIWTGDTTGSPVNDGDGAVGANIGLIIGIVLGVLAAIILVVVLVYFLVFRRRSGGGDDYDTGEGKDSNPDRVDNVVYTTPASNKPTRGKGRENDTFDEPHEKNPRPYYANDFGDQDRDRDRERGRSNPAMDNDSRHDRSFDDDNTPDNYRMKSPYGSAV